MAVLGRDEIQQNTNDKLPTNNAKLITAAKHREVLKDFRDSFFNLVDDELKNVTYGDSITLGDYLSTLFQNSVKRIKVGTFDVGGISIGDELTVIDDDDGLVSSAVVIGSAGGDTLIKITWSGSSGINTSNAKIPVLHYIGRDWNKSNDVAAPVIQDNAGSINVAFGEYRSLAQELELEIIIL